MLSQRRESPEKTKFVDRPVILSDITGWMRVMFRYSTPAPEDTEIRKTSDNSPTDMILIEVFLV
jgi:uncharacterized membrane protein affecting hemolysin expression